MRVRSFSLHPIRLTPAYGMSVLSADILSYPLRCADHGEGMQVLRYRETEQYEARHATNRATNQSFNYPPGFPFRPLTFRPGKIINSSIHHALITVSLLPLFCPSSSSLLSPTWISSRAAKTASRSSYRAGTASRRSCCTCALAAEKRHPAHGTHDPPQAPRAARA